MNHDIEYIDADIRNIESLCSRFGRPSNSKIEGLEGLYEQKIHLTYFPRQYLYSIHCCCYMLSTEYKGHVHAQGNAVLKVHYNFARDFNFSGSSADKLRRITFPLPVLGISSIKYRPPVSHL